MNKRLSVSRAHHFLPQCYLENFAVPRSAKVSQVVGFDRLNGTMFKTSTENVAQRRDFNRIEGTDEIPPDAFETSLARFEAELGPALTRILSSQSLTDQDDKIILMNFIGWIALHNPRWREMWTGFQETVIKRIMDLMTSTPEVWSSTVRQARQAGYVGDATDGVTYESVRCLVEADAFAVSVPNEHHIGLALDTLDTILDTLMKRKWWMVVAPPESGGFVTSDHPVVLMWSDPALRGGLYPPGHGRRGTQLTFPLSSRVALVGAFEIDEQVDVVDEHFVAQINAVTILHSDRQVYARDLHFKYQPYRERPMRKGSHLINDPLLSRVPSGAAGRKRDGQPKPPVR